MLFKYFGRKVKNISAVVLLISICSDSFTQTNFNCSTPLRLTGCNYIPNPGFELNNSSVLMEAFASGNVPSWGDSHGTSDINQIISHPSGVNVNFASMVVGAWNTGGFGLDPLYEGIVAKISPLTAHRTYALSFFLASSKMYSVISAATNVTFNVILIKCQDFQGDNGYVVPSRPNPNQPIYCETIATAGNAGWKQIFISFVADDDYDMIWIFPEQVTPPSQTQASYMHFAYPELIDVTDFSAGSSPSTANCNADIGPSPENCSVTNAQFTWTDPNDNIIYQGSSQSTTVNLGNAAGSYTLQMTVPGAATTNNTCSDNSPNIKESVSVPYVCDCDVSTTGLQFVNPAMEYYRFPDGVNVFSQGYYTENLSSCSTTVCQMIDEGILSFTLASNQTNGNIWEIYRDGILMPNQITNFGTSTPPDNTLQTYNVGVVFIAFISPTILEIRLTNTVLNETRQKFITIKPLAWLHTATCTTTTTPTGWTSAISANILKQYVTSSTQYVWDFSNAPVGFLVQSSTSDPNIIYDPTTVGSGFSATIRTIQSEYGCDRQRTFFLSPNAYQCGISGRLAVGNSNNQNNTTNHDDNELRLYPNPSTSSFSISSKKEIRDVAVYSVDGRMIKRFSKSDLNRPLNIKELNAGVYFIQIIFKDYHTVVKTIVKR